MSILVFVCFFSIRQGLSLKSCSYPDFSNPESNDVCDDQLCCIDNQRCRVPKLRVPELVSSECALIQKISSEAKLNYFFAQRKLGHSTGSGKNKGDSEKISADSQNINSETALFSAHFFPLGKGFQS